MAELDHLIPMATEHMNKCLTQMLRHWANIRFLVVVNVLMVLLLDAAPAQALLMPCTLEELVANSELIVQAEVTELPPRQTVRNADGSYTLSEGSALLRVVRTFKGVPIDDTIRIQFSDEVHEQRITTDKFQRLLFLKKDKDGKYTAAFHGRSYWPLVPIGDVEGRLAVPYDYPMTTIKVAESLLKQAELAIPELELDPYRGPVIFLDDLIAFLNPTR